MWLYNYYCLLMLFFISFMNCNFVKNNRLKEFCHENIYLAQDVVPSQIKRKFFEIMNYIISTKQRENNANRMYNCKEMYNSKEQDFKLKGAIVLLKKLKNEKSIQEATTKTHAVAREGLSIEYSRESRPKTNIDRSTPNILRDKYGDACIKVAVRKCYKALLAVNTNICKLRYKCKSSFKSYFKNKSKVGCIKEFDYSKGSNVKGNASSYYVFRDNKFVDATREGYLDTCIPFMVPNFKVTRRIISLRNDTISNVVGNVLRKSKSDKKCQRLSRTKCYRACSFTMKETCTRYNCSSRRKKTFSKTCKEECKRAYQVISTSDSDDSSGSD